MVSDAFPVSDEWFHKSDPYGTGGFAGPSADFVKSHVWVCAHVLNIIALQTTQSRWLVVNLEPVSFFVDAKMAFSEIIIKSGKYLNTRKPDRVFWDSRISNLF